MGGGGISYIRELFVDSEGRISVKKHKTERRIIRIIFRCRLLLHCLGYAMSKLKLLNTYFLDCNHLQNYRQWPQLILDMFSSNQFAKLCIKSLKNKKYLSLQGADMLREVSSQN